MEQFRLHHFSREHDRRSQNFYLMLISVEGKNPWKMVGIPAREFGNIQMMQIKRVVHYTHSSRKNLVVSEKQNVLPGQINTPLTS